MILKKKTLEPRGQSAPTLGQCSCILQKYSKIFSETAWPIKAKFYMKHLQDVGTNVFMNNLGHITKMVTMPIYGENPSNVFFFGTLGPISMKYGL